ncbi:hypothetical protein EJ110_NYTH57174 [Nymphaea thermarum]|nr:hypothetical protein EJ110_NYTH57174 [Nymphaea thermarum]
MHFEEIGERATGMTSPFTLPLVSPVRAQAVQGPRVLLCVVLGAFGSRLPNLGVLGKAECLTLDFTHPGMSALPLQRVLADPGQQTERMATLTSYWGVIAREERREEKGEVYVVSLRLELLDINPVWLIIPRTRPMLTTSLKRMNQLLKTGKYATWKENNSIVMSWIMESVKSDIAPTLDYYTTVEHMWTFLRQTYSHDKNVSKILQVEKELLKLQQGELSQYFALVKVAYERLKAIQPPCQACYKTHFEQTMVAKFLAGLPPKFEKQNNHTPT